MKPKWNELAAADAREQLRRWDAGETIWSLEMGGLGPGYEQSIQILAIEIVRDKIDLPLPNNLNPRSAAPDNTWADATIKRIDVPDSNGRYSCGGFSGAQVGVAIGLAWQWLTIGPAALLARPEARNRSIQVSSFWPHVHGERKR